jgi:1-acyl-sn-glycerol-3-phosphate acyltransferase
MGRSLFTITTPRSSIDGFTPSMKDAFAGASAEIASRFYDRVDWLGRKLEVDVVGIERLPPGRGLLVANHAFGWDTGFALARIQAVTGRRVWALGEHAWWVVPGLRRLAADVGIVDGTQANADALLAHDELVLVLPGGLREAMKPRELRYRLLWGHRYGFIRAAIRNHAPLVPLAAIGGDDAFELVGDAYRRARRLHLPFPLPRLHLLARHRAKFRYVIGEPIPTTAHAPGMEHDEGFVRRLRREVEGALHEIFEEELANAAHFPIDNPAHAH